MRSRWFSGSVPLLLCYAVLTQLGSTMPARGQLAVRVHVSSLDEFVADMAKATRSFPVPVTREMLFERLIRPYGLDEIPGLDSRRPWAVVLPMQGIQLGGKGVVLVLPVDDSQAALELIGAQFDAHTTDEGVHAFSKGEDSPLFAVPEEGYLLLSLNRAPVVGLSIETPLSRGDLPPGSVGLEIDLQTLMPILQGWLMMRQAMASQDAEGAEDFAVQAARIEAFQQRVTENVAGLQISLEVSLEHLIVHGRFVPIPGSPFEGILGGQTGDLPEVAQILKTPEMGSVAAGQVTLTPELMEVIQPQLEELAELLRAELNTAEDGEDSITQRQWLAFIAQLAGGGFDCFRGDFASTVERLTTGKRRLTIAGIKDPDACRRLMTEEFLADLQLQIVGDYLLKAGGPGAEEAMTELVDRVQRVSISPTGGGPDFSPLAVGPGVFVAEQEEFSELLLKRLGDLYALNREALAPGRNVHGARLETDGLMIESALPLTFLDSLGTVAKMAGGYVRPDGEPVPTSLTVTGKSLQPRRLWGARIEDLTGLATGDWDGDGRAEVLLAADDRIDIFTPWFTPQHGIRVPSGMVNIECGVHATGPRLLGYRNWGPEVLVVDGQGTELWRYSSPAGVNGAHWVDLDGDGNDEMIVGMNAAGGLHAVSEDGETLWESHKLANVWNQASAVTTGTGPLIFATEAMGSVRVFGPTGEMLRGLRPQKGYYSQMSAVAVGDDSVQILAVKKGADDQNVVTAFDEIGRTYWQAPTSPPRGGWRVTSFASGDVSGDGIPDWAFLDEQGELSVATAQGERLATLTVGEGLVDHVIVPRRHGRGILVTARKGQVDAYRLYAEGERVPGDLESSLRLCLASQTGCSIAVALGPETSWAYGSGWGGPEGDGLEIAMAHCADYRAKEGVAGECQPVIVDGKIRAEGLENPAPARFVVSGSLAGAFSDLDRHDEAVQVLQRALEHDREHGGEKAATLSALSWALKDKGDYAAGVDVARRALDLCLEQSLDERQCRVYWNNLGWFQMATGDFEEALPQFDRALELATTDESLGWVEPSTRSHYGACLSQLGRYDEAEKQLIPALENLAAKLGTHHSRTRFAARRLVDLYIAWDKADMAAGFRDLAAASGLEPWETAD